MLKINIRQLTNEGFDFYGKITSGDLGLVISDSSTELSFGKEVEYDLYVSSVSDGVLVAGSLSVDIRSGCGRCLEQYDFTLEINDICHFYEEFSGHDLDITDDIREDILIALPSKYLCSEKCKGLCTACGKNLNRERCNCKEANTKDEDANPWNALDSLEI